VLLWAESRIQNSEFRIQDSGFRMKRVRGALLRTVYARRAALAVGAALVAAALWLWFGDVGSETPLTDGLALVAGATGIAFIVAGLQGRRGDWAE
jgi:hypothetical protein